MHFNHARYQKAACQDMQLPNEYRACLTQALAAYQRRKNPETDEWLEDVLRIAKSIANVGLINCPDPWVRR